MTINHTSGWRREDLVYCSNVHAGESLVEIEQVISNSIAGVRKLRSLETMGSGLWLGNQVSEELLACESKFDRFKQILTKHAIQLHTLNGFPFGNFHRENVKSKVYYPDWSMPERLEYSMRLAQILARCLPSEETIGTISTLPLGFQPDWNSDRTDAALRQLCMAATALDKLKQVSGRTIQLCLEMEPGCVLENTTQLIELFTHDLPRVAASQGIDEAVIRRHLGVCFDVCHQAVMFEDIFDSLKRIHSCDIAIGKIQLSSAVEITDPDDDLSRQALAEFVEARYLHQVRVIPQDRPLQGAMDLSDALNSREFPTSGAWRIHFHIPVQAEEIAQGNLSTTRSSILQTLDFLELNRDLQTHLEIETYTWNVLPTDIRPTNHSELLHGITEELNWVESEMLERNLLIGPG